MKLWAAHMWLTITQKKKFAPHAPDGTLVGAAIGGASKRATFWLFSYTYIYKISASPSTISANIPPVSFSRSTRLSLLFLLLFLPIPLTTSERHLTYPIHTLTRSWLAVLRPFPLATEPKNRPNFDDDMCRPKLRNNAVRTKPTPALKPRAAAKRPASSRRKKRRLSRQ